MTRGARKRIKTSKTDESAAKLSGMRGLDIDLMFQPMRGKRLAVLAFVHMNHAFDIIVKTAERDLASHGLSVARYAILRMLEGREPVPLRWLADKHFSEKSNITAMVDRLVRDGMVQRLPDAIDRRVIRVRLTPKGGQTVQAARAPHLKFVARVMAPLDDGDLRLLIELLGKLSAPFEGINRNKLPSPPAKRRKSV
jgi:DNA-binding MarR family transcriptional regulator